MPLLGYNLQDKNRRQVPLTDYVGSFMAATFDANEVSLKGNPNSSRISDTLEFAQFAQNGLISAKKLVLIEDADGNPVEAHLPNKPDLRISDLAPYSALQDYDSPEGPGGRV